MPDTAVLYDRLTGLEHLELVADVRRIRREARTERVRELAALLAEPALLILDEPMVGLDPKSNHRLKQLMRAYCEAGRTVFFSTHILDVAERLCDRVGIIKSGRLIAVGTLDELRSAGRDDATLESIFLELTEEPAPEAAER